MIFQYRIQILKWIAYTYLGRSIDTTLKHSNPGLTVLLVDWVYFRNHPSPAAHIDDISAQGFFRIDRNRGQFLKWKHARYSLRKCALCITYYSAILHNVYLVETAYLADTRRARLSVWEVTCWWFPLSAWPGWPAAAASQPPSRPALTSPISFKKENFLQNIMRQYLAKIDCNQSWHSKCLCCVILHCQRTVKGLYTLQFTYRGSLLKFLCTGDQHYIP